MTVYTDPSLLRSGLVGGTLSRHTGNMRQATDQAPVFKTLSIPPERMLHLHQVHGDRIISLTDASHAQTYAAGPVQEADGWVLSPFPKGWGVCILTADCVPLFVWDESGRYAALAHCGWRGVVKNLAGQAVQALRARQPGLTLRAFIGPHIQACCFEVQQDVADQFAPACIEKREGKLFVNLTAALTQQLLQTGISKTHIYATDDCTCGDPENFFSWRRDHQKNLLLSFLYRP